MPDRARASPYCICTSRSVDRSNVKRIYRVPTVSEITTPKDPEIPTKVETAEDRFRVRGERPTESVQLSVNTGSPSIVTGVGDTVSRRAAGGHKLRLSVRSK